MDGARFANALATLNCSPADITWRAGVDVLSFGGSKNGCIAAEAVVFFNKDDVKDFEYRRKRAGHLWSKHRFLSAQFEAYLANDHWLELASHANAMATKLSDGLAKISGVKIWYPTEANEVFASFPPDSLARLQKEGAQFFPWITPGDPASGTMNRLICSFATTPADVDAFLAVAAKGV